jgi:hypothetical protein
VGILCIGSLPISSLGYVRHQGVLVVKTQWKLYQALELIPESESYPKSSWFAWLTAPIRRPFANVFTRDLSHRHQVLLLKRCLTMPHVPQPKSSSQESRQVTNNQVLAPQQHLTAQPWLDQGEWPG